MIERVLIHPVFFHHIPEISEVWEEWKKLPTKVIEADDYKGLEDTSYLDALDPETLNHLVSQILVVGGQSGGVCVKAHLEALAQHPRVKGGMVEIQLSLSATLANNRDQLVSVLKSIRDQFGVTIKITE